MKKFIISSILVILSAISFQSYAAMYIIGYNGKWTAGSQEMMTETSTGVYSITKNITTDIYFVFMDTNSDSWTEINNGHRFGAGTGSDYDLTIGTPSPVVNDKTGNGSYHFKGAGHNYTVTYDTNAGTVLVTGDEAKQSFYVVTADGYNPWDLTKGDKMATNADTSEYSLSKLYVEANGNDGYGYVIISSALASTSTDWDEFNTHRYAAKDCKGDFLLTAAFVDSGCVTLENFKTGDGSFKVLAGYYNLKIVKVNGEYCIYFSSALPSVLGDINGDGEVDVSDVTALMNHILGIKTYDEEVCDITGNGNIDVSDVTALINMILGGGNIDVKTINSMLVCNLSTDKACYKPGETVIFTVDSKPATTTYVRYRSATTNIKEEELTSTTWSWTPPTTDYTGYMVDLYQKTSSTVETVVGTIAVDVSSDWKAFPRYGFVATFGNDKTESVTLAEMANLARCHINGVQFQDWHCKHHWPLGGTRTAPSATYTDIANRTIYKKAVENYISASHAFGMNAIFYNLCFGALDDANADGVSDEWYVFTDKNHSSKDYHPLKNIGWKSDIFLVNPGNTNWQTYLAQRNDDVYYNFDFDGYQIDQLGSRGTLYDYNGNQVDLTQGYSTFINAMKEAHPTKNLVMNAVSNYGQQNILGTGKVDFAYNEMWQGEDQYTSLRSTILNNNQYSSNKCKTVFAAYMNYGLGNGSVSSSGYFNNPGVILTDAVMFALGATHLELGGDHMLTTEYFPNAALKMNSDLQTAMIRYYDFQTAYENLLMDESYELNLAVTCSSGQSLKVWNTSQGPEKGYIMVYSKKVGTRQVTHLLNFVNANSTSWRDYNGDMPSPKNFFNVTLNVPYSGVAHKVWVASPDQHGGVIQYLNFTQSGTSVTVTLPKLQYWDMLVIE